MKTPLSLALVLLTVGLVSTQATVAGEPYKISAGTVSSSPVLHLNLGPTDPVIDPALARPGSAEGFVADQLFLGLVREDEVTGAPIPELATSWVMSPDATVFTFTLRSGLTWSDGNRLTAYDVRYGILRSLDPATQSEWAFPLFWIQNAEAYNTGVITDPDR